MNRFSHSLASSRLCTLCLPLFPLTPSLSDSCDPCNSDRVSRGCCGRSVPGGYWFCDGRSICFAYCLHRHLWERSRGFGTAAGIVRLQLQHTRARAHTHTYNRFTMFHCLRGFIFNHNINPPFLRSYASWPSASS